MPNVNPTTTPIENPTAVLDSFSEGHHPTLHGYWRGYDPIIPHTPYTLPPIVPPPKPGGNLHVIENYTHTM